MNTEIFRLINNLAYKNASLDAVMIFYSKYVPYIFMLTVAIIFFTGVVKNNEEYRKASVNTITITVINLLLSALIGAIYYVDRPFVHNKVNLLVPHVKDASFPSDHAMGTMSIALGLGKMNRILGIMMTVLSLVVGFSRVYVGNHYPLDVIDAYIIVIIINYLYNLVLRNKIGELYKKIEKLLLSKLKIGKDTEKSLLNN